MELLEKENRKLRRKLEEKEHEESVEMESLEREKRKLRQMLDEKEGLR